MLTRILIHNYRSLVNFELRPGRINLLLGYNGSGKTSIFAVLAAITDLLRGQAEIESVFPIDTLSTLGEGAQQKFELDLESPHGPMRYQLVVEHDRDDGTCRIVREQIDVKEIQLYSYSDGTVHVSGNYFQFVADRSFFAMMEHTEQTAPALAWLRDYLQNIWLLKLDPQTIPAVSHKDEAALHVDGSNFPSWFRHLALERREQLQDAELALRDVLPGFRSLSLQTAGRARVLVARFEAPGKKTHDVDFDRLSDGQRALIILYVVLHAIKRDTGLLCLDEPDNFVAIREIQPFLVELTKMCEDTDKQALLVSHSAEVVDFFSPSEAILLERPDGGATRVGDLRAGAGLKLSELLARGWHGAR